MVKTLSLSPEWLTHSVISDKVQRLFVKLSFFRPDRFVQLLNLIRNLILLISPILKRSSVYWFLRVRYLELFRKRTMSSKFYSNCSGAETTSSFSTTNNCQC